MNYQFDCEHITQRIIKFGIDITPAVTPEQDKTRLQDYCNWLLSEFPQTYETLLSGPKQLQVNRTFVLNDGKRVETPTFVVTPKGVVFIFPQRLFINQPQDIEISQHDKIFRKALDELRVRFADKKFPRIGVINDIVFDSDTFNSLDIIASNLKSDLWREKTKGLRIFLDIPIEDKNVNVEIRPTFIRRTGKDGIIAQETNISYGIVVNVNISNLQIPENLSKIQVNDVLTFAEDYVPDELIKFLNSEY